jgi:ParB family chromosome partitioning protein
MTTATQQQVVVREISLEQIDASLNNPRRTMNEADLAELAASIREHGIQVPLLVRPKPGTDLNARGKNSGPEEFEIVAGHRRSEAATIAGLTTVPCIVREMSDAKAAELAVVDNLQRVNIPPMEEAMAFAELLRAPGATVESVAAAVGKAGSYVGRRLKLLDAIEPVREALAAGAIEVGHALEIARLDPKQQATLLEWLQVGFIADDDEDDEDEFDDNEWDQDEDGENPLAEEPKEKSKWRQTRHTLIELKRQIGLTALRVLVDAPFPLEDEIPPMACAECPKRSINAVLLFADVQQDTCTDRACYDAKVKVWIKAQLAAADREKRQLIMIDAEYSRTPSTLAYHDVRIIGLYRDRNNPPCDSQEPAIWINGARAGHLLSICRDPKCKVHKGEWIANSSSSPGSSKAADAKAQAERKKKLQTINAEKKYRAELFKAVATAPINTLYASDLNLAVCRYAIGRGPGQYEKKVAEALGWPADIFGWKGTKDLEAKLTGLAPVERLRVALLAAHAGELGVSEYSPSKAEQLEKLAGFLGVDVKRIRENATNPKPAKATAEKAGAKPAALPKPEVKPTDKPAKKAAPAKAAKKGVLSAEAKKRIAAAQKKRWTDQAKKKGGAK